MLNISARARPTRSAMNPKSTPPMPDASSVSVFSSPAWALVMPEVAHDVSDDHRVQHYVEGIEHPAETQPQAACGAGRA